MLYVFHFPDHSRLAAKTLRNEQKHVIISTVKHQHAEGEAIDSPTSLCVYIALHGEGKLTAHSAKHTNTHTRFN